MPPMNVPPMVDSVNGPNGLHVAQLVATEPERACVHAPILNPKIMEGSVREMGQSHRLAIMDLAVSFLIVFVESGVGDLPISKKLSPHSQIFLQHSY